ncbi:hypothetical protein C1Y40_05610 [Mycobacterium talmoniae]|uniref:Uncharacterized protein n=1 Tax=Mycobacterium talmoniae TaxID=1858794 RepID=A0A2S8BC49_9MYCO|nr:hypothetical protein C1Y40_05610 [Mycobacterium talmoniae]
MSSTTAKVRMKIRSRGAFFGPTSASTPSANAVSVEITTPQPVTAPVPQLTSM